MIYAVIAVAVLGGAVLVGRLPALRNPAFVEQLTVENPHPWRVNVDTSDSAGGGWVLLGSVERESSRTILETMDQGSRWLFRFSYAGTDGGTLEVSGEQLEQSDWRITIPDSFGQRMRGAGIGPSARPNVTFG